MLVSICAQFFDPDGHVALDVQPFSEQGATARRVNRVATLDGGAALNDYGHSEADRIFELRWTPKDEVQERNIDRMVQTHPRVTFANRQGVYLCVPESYTPGDQTSQLRLLVMQKLSED